MSVSADEVEKMVASRKKAARRRYAEEFWVEVVQCYLKVKEHDLKKVVMDCVGVLGTNEKTFNDRVVKFGD